MSQTNIKKIDKFIPWMFVLFFIVVACVDAVFMTTAIRTQTGLVTDKAYETGLKYNDILKASDDQKKLGWSHELSVSKDGAIKFILKDKQGKKITGAVISLLCFRSTQDGMDIEQKLVETEAGNFVGPPGFSGAGVGEVFFSVKVKRGIYKGNKKKQK